jgi:predicted phage baseplate assembly protein
MLHATVAFTPGLTLPATPAASAYTVRWDWLAVGRIVPVLAPSDYRYSGTNSIVVDAASKASFPTSSAAALLEDQAGVAAQATVAPQGGDPATATLSGFSTTSPPKFSTPIDVLFNLIAVSRGKTVASEVLGSGDTRAAGQDFTLVKSPVTYFYDPASKSGDGFSSTAKVSVNGIQWREARSFFGAAPTDQIFVLREDDQGQTHVQFGDGANGARLPTGVGNVVATYRYGAEGDPPDPETLTTVLTPVPGLKGVRNPLPPTGGADPDSAARIRTLAPASVLTLNRVVSIDDFAVTAATAGGVTKTAASFDVDPVSGRPMTTVYVAGDDGAVASATAALAGAGAPMANVLVVPATPVEMVVTVSFLRDPRYADTDVSARLRTALADPDAGLLGANVLSVGQAIYDSQIAMACLAVAGVEAVTAISFAPPGLRLVPEVVFGRIGFVWRRPIGGLLLSSSARHDPGVGKYFFVPNDTGHVQISGSAGP